MNKGTIKWLSYDNGFGFITNDDSGGDIFFRLSSIVATACKALEAGLKVTYDTEKDPKGNYQIHAINIYVSQ